MYYDSIPSHIAFLGICQMIEDQITANLIDHLISVELGLAYPNEEGNTSLDWTVFPGAERF